MLSFSRDPKGYIQDLLCSQSRDLKVKGTWGAQQHCNPAPALISLKIQQRRQELEQSLVVRNT